jgi:hypothetical protein
MLSTNSTMVESINLGPGPSVCRTADIIIVVGCQRAGVHTASLPSPADFSPNESSRRSRKAQPDCVFTTRKLCQKPGQEATALDDSSAPADALVSLATRCIGTIPAVARTPSPSLTPSGEPVFCLLSPCRDRRKYAGGMGTGQSRRRAGRALTGMRGHDAFRPSLADQTCRMSTCSTTSKRHAPEDGSPLARRGRRGDRHGDRKRAGECRTAGR